MRYVHLCSDEKFIDRFIDRLREVDELEKHQFYVWSRTGTLQKVKYPAAVPLPWRAYRYTAKLIEAAQPDILILHSLSTLTQRTLKFLPAGYDIRWIFYGFEFFGRAELRDRYLAPATRTFMKSKERSNLVQGTIESLKQWNKKLLLKRTIRRIRFFANWVPEDFAAVKAFCPDARISHLNFCYGGGMLNIDRNDPKDLMIGNSSDPTNNHLDVFERVKAMGSEQYFERIIVPLSYGCADQSYLDEVCQRGETLFGAKFTPLLDFQPLDDYLETLAGVRVAIMGHLRTQAGANIRFLLKEGVSVVLYPTNPLYSFFQAADMDVFNAETELAAVAQGALLPDQERNGKLISAIFTGEHARAYYRRLIDPSLTGS